MTTCFCKSIVLLILLLYLPMCWSNTENKPKSGPFKASVQSVTTCTNPSRPYLSDPPIKFTPMLYNSSKNLYMGGSIIISSDTTSKNVKYRMKRFNWENGKWKVNYIVNDLGCHGGLIDLICGAIGVKYDKKKCMYLKGEYVFKKLDVNYLQHLWGSKMEYGQILWRTEVFSQQGTFYCYEFLSVCEPAE